MPFGGRLAISDANRNTAPGDNQMSAGGRKKKIGHTYNDPVVKGDTLYLRLRRHLINAPGRLACPSTRRWGLWWYFSDMYILNITVMPLCL